MFASITAGKPCSWVPRARKTRTREWRRSTATSPRQAASTFQPSERHFWTGDGSQSLLMKTSATSQPRSATSCGRKNDTAAVNPQRPIQPFGARSTNSSSFLPLGTSTTGKRTRTQSSWGRQIRVQVATGGVGPCTVATRLLMIGTCASPSTGSTNSHWVRLSPL